MFRSVLTGSVAAVAMMAATAASAATIDGTAAVSMIGIGSSDATIGLNTVFTNTINSVIGSTTGDLNGTAGTVVNIGPVTATLGSVVSFTSTIGDFTGTVAARSASGPVNSRVVDVYALGTFTPAGVLSGFDAGAMSLTFSFTQTGGANSAVSGSFTMASPPAPPRISEPATLALLGAGLLGLAAVRRRKA